MAIPVRSRVAGVTYGNAHIQAQVFWDDAPLKTAGRQAFVTAGRQAGEVARAKAPASAIARSISTRFYSGGAATGTDISGIIRASSPLAHLFELGTKPHVIAPSALKSTRRGREKYGRTKVIGVDALGKNIRTRNVAMKFPDGGFARGPVNHPGMSARPFLRPAAAAFPGLYSRSLAQQLRY